MSVPIWEWPNCEADRVIDGDTFVAILTRDIGFYGTTTFRVKFRVAGINAPAFPGVLGADSRDALALLLSKQFTIVSGKPYKYGGEWMATVTTIDGKDVATTMINNGHAVAWSGRGPKPGEVV